MMSASVVWATSKAVINTHHSIAAGRRANFLELHFAAEKHSGSCPDV